MIAGHLDHLDDTVTAGHGHRRTTTVIVHVVGRVKAEIDTAESRVSATTIPELDESKLVTGHDIGALLIDVGTVDRVLMTDDCLATDALSN